MNYAGIDYHKRYSVVCILDATGNILHEERIEHGFPERFNTLLGVHALLEVAFEATMNWKKVFCIASSQTIGPNVPISSTRQSFPPMSEYIRDSTTA